jgi:hypothetical protein
MERWQGSPLHQYLEEVNLAARAQPFLAAPAPSRRARLAAWIESLLSHLSKALPRGLDVKAAAYCYAKQLADSSQLLLDDVNILRSLDTRLSTDTGLPSSFLKSKRAWVLLLAGPATLAWSLLRQQHTRFFHKPTGWLATMPLLCGSVGSGWILYRSWQHTRNAAAVAELNGALLALEMSLARAIRFIQEIELVSRGFALSAYHLPPISRLEAASQARKCPLLRKVPVCVCVCVCVCECVCV